MRWPGKPTTDKEAVDKRVRDLDVTLQYLRGYGPDA